MTPFDAYKLSAPACPTALTDIAREITRLEVAHERQEREALRAIAGAASETIRRIKAHGGSREAAIGFVCGLHPRLGVEKLRQLVERVYGSEEQEVRR